MRAIRSAVRIGASAAHTASGPWRSMIRLIASVTAAIYHAGDPPRAPARRQLAAARSLRPPRRGAAGDALGVGALDQPPHAVSGDRRDHDAEPEQPPAVRPVHGRLVRGPEPARPR